MSQPRRPDTPPSPPAEIISSAVNPTIKLARSLHRKRVRQRERALLVEGLRAISTAVEHGVRVRTLIVDAERADAIDTTVLQPLTNAAGRVIQVTPELFAEITQTEQPQPLIAICEMPDRALPGNSSLLLVCDGVRDPGNLGTLIRSAAAAGADGIVLLPGCVDPYNAKTVRATAGSVFALPVGFARDVAQVTERYFVEPPAVVIANAIAELSYDAIDWRVPVALVVGGEAVGESDETRTYATSTVKIPMQPGIESLNAAVAGSILLFEAARQRRQPI